MIIESFLISSLVPAVLLSIVLLGTRTLKILSTKILLESALFLGAVVYGLYVIKGGAGRLLLGGVEALILLPFSVFLASVLMVFFRAHFLIMALVVAGSIYFISKPLPPSDVALRVSFAFGLLALSAWSFSKRRLEGHYWVGLLSALPVCFGAAAIYFLMNGSALLSQVFGMYATFSGVLLFFALCFGWRVSSVVAASFLVGLPLISFSMGALFLEVRPLSLLWLCLPFLIPVIRPMVAVSLKNRWVEAVASTILASLSVSWLIL